MSNKREQNTNKPTSVKPKLLSKNRPSETIIVDLGEEMPLFQFRFLFHEIDRFLTIEAFMIVNFSEEEDKEDEPNPIYFKKPTPREFSKGLTLKETTDINKAQRVFIAYAEHDNSIVVDFYPDTNGLGFFVDTADMESVSLLLQSLHQVVPGVLKGESMENVVNPELN